jgi:hypothetical protein
MAMKRTTRRALSIGAIVILAVAGYFVYRYVAAMPVRVPEQFDDARAKGGVISEDIVRISEALKADIIRANELDKQRKYKEASEATAAASLKVGEVRAKALELAGELERMTEVLPGIRSAEARAAATEAISKRLELIQHLITYSEKTTELLVALENHFGGARNEQVIEQLLYDVNTEITSINEINRLASEAMQKFDEIAR